MAVLTDREVGESEDVAQGRRRPATTYLGLAGVVALVASTIVIAGLSLIGDSWRPSGDWAAMAHRVSQVGSSETPLVGLYSRGHAHPGPLGVWLGAPLWNLTGGEPLSMAWTAAIVNVVVIVALGVFAWRYGRWPLFLGTMAMVALLVRGLGPALLVDLWNPYVPLLAFLVTILLVWQAGQGHKLALVAAIVPGSLALQSHIGYVPLLGALTLWLAVWLGQWRYRFTSADVSSRGSEAEGESARQPWREIWDDWVPALRRVGLLGLVLWLPPLLDALVGVHNPLSIARTFGSRDAVGPINGVGLVGRYVRPDGPWMGGYEMPDDNIRAITGSGPLPVVLAVIVLVGCLYVARRRGLADVGALASLSLVLLVAALPTAAQVPLPLEAYLVQWLKVIGALVWFTVGWTLWRSAEPYLHRERLRLRLAALAVGAVTLAATTSQWHAASATVLLTGDTGARTRVLVSHLEGKLPRDATIRVADRGDPFRVYGAGVFSAMIEDGYDVVTDDGAKGLKWGPSRRWQRGDPYDVLLTVAADRTNEECSADPDAQLLSHVDGLSGEERAWLNEVQLRRLGGEDQVTEAERDRATALGERDYRIGIYASEDPCAEEPEEDKGVQEQESALPVAVAGLVVVAAAGGWLVWRRRQGVTSG